MPCDGDDGSAGCDVGRSKGIIDHGDGAANVTSGGGEGHGGCQWQQPQWKWGK